ncbi:hypothetical protein HCN44_009531 [Aphidius gifuensis]|uniref:Succinate dehydrogenase assembly factor 4, mitochondrial n=1 Tax=Aphidius gifuensis TaxID=684658 RepID=A0A835CY52_APHGI|nr:succinate dehydrogenase assembly factor 4, mitochondrial-like [Aphidius gifuensis]KAF7998133.1 hypothetical protein HCN44_009531 [Aphidius gifuensis]
MSARRLFISSNNLTIMKIFSRYKSTKNESERMKKFHDKLNKEIPNEPLLIETDPKSGELIPDSEKNPTKWGDWQHAGRVTDF